MPYDEVLAALADPTRRGLLEHLRRREYSVGELSKRQRISQPAVSQHLRALSGARLVTCRQEGTRRFYRADPAGLEELRRWVDTFWGDVLEAFASK